MLITRDFVRARTFPLVLEFAVHPPRNPQEEDSAGQDEADNLEELRDYKGKSDPQHQGRDHTDEDDLLPLVRWKPRSQRADNNCIVASKDDVDEEDLEERRDGAGRD